MIQNILFNLRFHASLLKMKSSPLANIFNIESKSKHIYAVYEFHLYREFINAATIHEHSILMTILHNSFPRSTAN